MQYFMKKMILKAGILEKGIYFMVCMYYICIKLYIKYHKMFFFIDVHLKMLKIRQFLIG